MEDRGVTIPGGAPHPPIISLFWLAPRKLLRALRVTRVGIHIKTLLLMIATATAAAASAAASTEEVATML